MPDRVACSVCKSVLVEPAEERADSIYFNCPRCGTFGLTRTAEAAVRGAMADASARQIASLCHALRRMQSANANPLLGSDVAERLVRETPTLPTAHEQADNLTRLLGDTAAPGEFLQIRSQDTGAIIGTLSADGWAFVVEGMASDGRLDVRGSPQHGAAFVRLTFDGWARYQELRRGAQSGRNAFMAMQYGNDTLDAILNDHFRPAVRQTGFDLKRLDDEPKAGPIDARMMLDIKAAWFLIADLTHGNRGAYWEAGYAAGLGKPVIYTCERSVWDKEKTHFDTNHHLHVVWDAANMAPAIRELKATIRFTIPEAKQQDD